MPAFPIRQAKVSKKRKLSQAAQADNSSSSTLAGEESYSEPYGKDWNDEQDYEQRGVRSLNKRKQEENTRLPIRTADGGVVTVRAPAPTVEEYQKKDNDEKLESFAMTEIEEKKVEPKKPERQRIIEAKEELARLATIINEDPEENAYFIKKLKDIFDGDTSIVVKKLALATQLTVFTDIIPGYRIRPLTAEEAAAKVTKDVKRLRGFENQLISSYQDYINTLAELARAPRKTQTKEAKELSKVAITCACTLLDAVPHFNFRTELLKVIIEKLSIRTLDESFVKCKDCIETLFRNDDSGTSSLEAVGLICRMLKAKDYYVNEAVLNTFLSLRLLSELDVRASTDTVENSRKIKKKEREPWSKKKRKMAKEQKAIDAQMKEADAVVEYEERERMQSETLKLVFVTYFKILKQNSDQLMAATLEGLAKFAHLINVDFFGNILEALKDLISDAEAAANPDPSQQDTSDTTTQDDTNDTEESMATRNATRESLLCIATAFALLTGQTTDGSTSMNLDLTFFTNHLYSSLLLLSLSPTLEFSSKSLQLPDPSSTSPSSSANNNNNNNNNNISSLRRVDLATEIEMLIRSLDAIFFKSSTRGTGTIPAARVAAFTKRLYISTLSMSGEKSSIAMLTVLKKLVKMHGRRLGPLFNSDDRRGDGVYDAVVGSAELSNPFASSVMWETVLLEKHYSPKVREGAGEVLKVFSGL